MKTVLVLLDPVNRNMLSCLDENSWVKTFNIDRLGKISTCVVLNQGLKLETRYNII